ncbi:MAG: DUF2997 domain-containing protein [Candidatus Heimdallarchaeota archaeon]|nr:DUF2997 domain-containing protein [Candidatus Heimdallarchaeota archaeon]
MSSVTKIRITHEQGFASKECLEEALTIHDLRSGFHITRVGDKYQLNTSSSSRDGDKLKMENDLKKRLDEIVSIILPTYTRLLATDDFNSKGFFLKRNSKDMSEETLVFQRINSFSEKDVPEQIIIKIRRDYNLTIDTNNFTGKKCLETTKQFEDKIGQVIHREMKPETATSSRKLATIQITLVH